MKRLMLTLLVAATAPNGSLYASACCLEWRIVQEKEYKKVDAVQVPIDILKAVSAKYSGYALNEAYASEDGEYKLVLAKDGKKLTAYYKATGEFIKDDL